MHKHTDRTERQTQIQREEEKCGEEEEKLSEEFEAQASVFCNY